MKYICLEDYGDCIKGEVVEISSDNASNKFFKPFKFEVGDIVSHVLYNGEFELLKNDSELFPLTIECERFEKSFMPDGKYDCISDRPSIHFIRRPSLEVKEKNEIVLSEYFNLCSSAIVFLDSSCAKYDIYSKNVQDENPNVVQKIENGRKFILDLDTWELRGYKDGE